MDAIETLMNEHRVIERVLDALVGFADEVRRKGTTEKEELTRFVSFVREFADAYHHGKEEDVLFAALVEAGFPRQAGPVGVMLSEHHEGRRLVSILRRLAEQAEPWTAAERQLLVEAAHGYGALLRQHIHKEDAILYPMAEQRLAPEAQARVDARCTAADAGQQAGIEELHALGEELVRIHAPHATSVAPSRAAFAGCC